MTDRPVRKGPMRLPAAAMAGAVLCLMASGLLLWWHSGEAVFTNVAAAAFAWCF